MHDELIRERDELRAWIIEADAAFNLDGKPAASVDECMGLVRMCHEGRAAIDEVARLRAELDTARDMLRNVPVPDYRSEYAEWQSNVDDYLETT